MLNGSFALVGCSLWVCVLALGVCILSLWACAVCVNVCMDLQYVSFCLWVCKSVCTTYSFLHFCVYWISRDNHQPHQPHRHRFLWLSHNIFCYKCTINWCFKTPFLAVWVCLPVVLSPIWKVWSLAFIPATCQEWVRSVYQTKTVSCHLLKSQIRHPKISWSLSSTGNCHMRMKTAFCGEIIRKSCQSRWEMMCES